MVITLTSFVYEFLLRMTYKDVKVMTIPKIGYLHTNMRPHSLFWDFKHNEENKIKPEEANFWMDIAKKEYFYTHDREVQYEG